MNKVEPKISLLDFLGEKKCTTEFNRPTLSTNPSAPKLIEEGKKSNRKITEQLISGAEMIELENKDSELDNPLMPLYAPLTPDSTKFVNEIQSPSINYRPQVPNNGQKLKIIHFAENDELTLSDTKQPINRSIIKPSTVSKLDNSINYRMKTYIKDRVNHLKVVMNILKEKSQRVSKKREILDELINKNSDSQFHGNIKQVINEELLRLKSIVCKNATYLETVNTYIFGSRRLGWRIPVDRPFIHLPWIDFELPFFPLLFRIEILIEDVKKIDMSSALSILSYDIP